MCYFENLSHFCQEKVWKRHKNVVGILPKVGLNARTEEFIG